MTQVLECFAASPSSCDPLSDPGREQVPLDRSAHDVEFVDLAAGALSTKRPSATDFPASSPSRLGKRTSKRRVWQDEELPTLP